MSENARRIRKGYRNKWQVKPGQAMEEADENMLSTLHIAGGQRLRMKVTGRKDKGAESGKKE